MNTLDCSVAFFDSLSAKAKNQALGAILNKIKNGEWAGLVEALRKPDLSKAAKNEFKRRLPALLVSGVSRTGHKTTDIEAHTGLLQLDIDNLGSMKAEQVRDRIGCDPYILAAFVSPSGNGAKAIMRVPDIIDGHRRSFEAAASYMKGSYGLEIDPACKDIARLCFVSHDPSIRIQVDAETLPVAEFPDARAPKPVHSSESLSTESCVLSPAFCVLGNTFDDWPELRPLYRDQVTKRYGTPNRGQRNECLVNLCSALYYMVKPDWVLAFALKYYQDHQDVFVDYPEAEFIGQAKSVIEGCSKSFPQELTPHEWREYRGCADDIQRAAFRICRSLSGCVTNPILPPPTFAMSAQQLAIRLGKDKMTAFRILRSFEGRGVIHTVEKGTLRTKGMQGKATVYRWLLGAELT